MPDLKLDPQSGDLFQAPTGDLALTNDATGETTAQLAKIGLRLFLGEWFLNNAIGIDFFGHVFVKNPDLVAIEGLVKDTLLGIPGVTGIASYSQALNHSNRTLTVSGFLLGDGGLSIPFQQVLGPEVTGA